MCKFKSRCQAAAKSHPPSFPRPHALPCLPRHRLLRSISRLVIPPFFSERGAGSFGRKNFSFCSKFIWSPCDPQRRMQHRAVIKPHPQSLRVDCITLEAPGFGRPRLPGPYSATSTLDRVTGSTDKIRGREPRMVLFFHSGVHDAACSLQPAAPAASGCVDLLPTTATLDVQYKHTAFATQHDIRIGHWCGRGEARCGDCLRGPVP